MNLIKWKHEFVKDANEDVWKCNPEYNFLITKKRNEGTAYTLTYVDTWTIRGYVMVNVTSMDLLVLKQYAEQTADNYEQYKINKQ